VLLLALAGVFFWLAASRVSSRRVSTAATILAVAAALAYPNLGLFHVRDRSPIHWHDSFHYFMGPKYLPELGYTRLYEATWVAGRELGAFAQIRQVRDLATYALRDVATIDAAAVRARFSPARWEAFKRDLRVFGPRINHWDALLLDHGYNDPPPRALTLHLLVRGVPASAAALGVVTSLDYLLMAIAFLAVRRAFGGLAAALAFAFLALSFFARFDFIGGSPLRWDWTAALLVGVAALARGAGVVAGLGFGYAVLARVFPVLFLVPLVVAWAHARLTGAREAALARCLATTAALVTAVTLALVAAPTTRTLSQDFVAKIERHNRGVYINHVGVGSLFVFHTTPWIERPDGTVFVSHEAALAARPAPWVLPAAAVLYFALALPLILRARPLESLMYAVPLVFVALSPAGYYYSFLVLLVLVPWRDGVADPVRLVAMGLLAVVSAAGYALELASADMLPLFYNASIQLGLFFVVWLALEYVRLVGRPATERAALGH
jgi:hypothetical protein